MGEQARKPSSRLVLGSPTRASLLQGSGADGGGRGEETWTGRRPGKAHCAVVTGSPKPALAWGEGGEKQAR